MGVDLIPRASRKAATGEATPQEPFNPMLQHRLACAIVDAEAGSDPTMEDLVKVAHEAGLSSETFLQMLDDADFKVMLEELRWSVLVDLNMGAILKAAVQLAKMGEIKAIDKLITFNRERQVRFAERRKELVSRGNREQLIEYARRTRDRLSRLIEALEDRAIVDITDKRAEDILDQMEDPDRKLDESDNW